MLHSFNGGDGENPGCSLVAGGSPPALFETTLDGGSGGAVDGSKGNAGVVFRLDPPASGAGTWTYTALHAFNVTPHGRGNGEPISLTFGLHRFLFGVNSSGGKFGVGAVFVVSPHIPPGRRRALAPA